MNQNKHNNTPQISILIPFFGNFDNRRLETAIKSVQDQSEKRIELLICNGIRAVPFESYSNVQDELKSITNEAIKIKDVPRGIIYNIGIRRARGEYVYVSDADIIFPERFFEELIQTSKALNTPLQRPMMRRLLLQDFEKFYESCLDKGLQDTIKSLDFSQEFIVKPDKDTRELNVIRKWENGRIKTFISTVSDFNEYKSNPENKGQEPIFFNQERHCGSTFARKSELENLGGCCEEFISWGCWDADLQWKLKETYGISYMPGEVIHLDHAKGYFNKEKWQKDRIFQEKRRAKEASKCVQEDKEIYLSE